MEKRKKEYLDWFKKKSDQELIDVFNGEVGNPGWVSARADHHAAMFEEFDNRHYDYSVIKSANGIFFRHKVKFVVGSNKELELLFSKEEERMWFLIESWNLGIRRNKSWIEKDDGGIFLMHKIKPVDNYNFELLLSKSKEEEKRKVNRILLKPKKYTFDNFVVEAHNRFAHKACLAVAQSPAKFYNPLFVYGENVSERTHLMQAIGNYITRHSPRTKILFVSAAKFTNELISAIRDDRISAFRDKYCAVDVLLIDNIQFLAGKERAQEEFFHTFNTLYEEGKQIVITSDKPPEDILTLEKRLISRFKWGLITDITYPDFETRTAILRKKARSANLNVPDEVIDFIVDKIPSNINIRQLEEALIDIITYSALIKRNLSIPPGNN